MKMFLGCLLLVYVVSVGCDGSSPTSTPTPASELRPSGPTSGSPSPATVSPGQKTGAMSASSPTPVPPDVPGRTPEAASTPTVTPVSIAMVSKTTVVGQAREFSVELILDPQGRGISGVQVRIEYDPTILQAVGVEHGDLLGPEPVEVHITDEEKGVIEYAAARIGPTEPPTSSGTFATLKLRVLGNAQSGTEATLRMSEVKIPDENIREIHPISIGDDLRLEISG